MQNFCGLDFGTSNSTIGTCIQNQCRLVPLENNKPAIRSAIFSDNEKKQFVFGQTGVNDYLEGIPGRLLMAIKSVLGSPLMEEETIIFGESIAFKKILAHFIKHIKSLAESYLGDELTHVVMGRPVRFDDHDIVRDAQAQKTLEELARDVGFKEVIFQYEPIAAAMTYEMSISSEKLALIVDMGGGTSDFSVIRLRPDPNPLHRSEDVLANCGIHIAGTDFDQRLSLKTIMPLLGMGSLMRASSCDIEVPSMFYHDLTTWHTLNSLYKPTTINHVKSIQAMAYDKNAIARLIRVLQTKAGHHILDLVEVCKQRLSDETTVSADISFIEDALTVVIDQEKFNHAIEEDVQRIIDKISQTCALAGVKPRDINAIFYTGGSTKIPSIREKINKLFPEAEVVQGDAFGSVGLGLTLDAQRQFGS